jgi:DNA ligase (NAD+)
MENDPKKIIGILRDLVNYYSYCYYVKSESKISDAEYDKLYRKLCDMEEKYPEYYDKDSPTQRLTNQIE